MRDTEVRGAARRAACAPPATRRPEAAILPQPGPPRTLLPSAPLNATIADGCADGDSADPECVDAASERMPAMRAALLPLSPRARRRFAACASASVPPPYPNLCESRPIFHKAFSTLGKVNVGGGGNFSTCICMRTPHGGLARLVPCDRMSHTDYIHTPFPSLTSLSLLQ